MQPGILIPAARLHPRQVLAEEAHSPLPKVGDAELGRPERPCARCGTTFKPTLRRRVLCARCFVNG